MSRRFSKNYSFEKCGNDEDILKRTKRSRRYRKYSIRAIIYSLSLLFLVILIVLVAIPLLFKYSNDFRRLCVFRTTADLPIETNYSNIEAFGLKGASNFYLYNKDIKLGLWHIPSTEISNENLSHDDIWGSSNQRSIVILYNHGNSGSRGTSYRIDLYKMLRKNFDVLTYDYRGFGDSTGGRPTSEYDVVEDGIFVTRWALRHLPATAKLILWGHSMGTSVVLAATEALKKEKLRPAAIILESTFHSGRETLPETPSLKFFRFLPWFDACFLDPLMDGIGRFQNYEYLRDVDCPILILHSEDDKTIPYKHAEKLYREALENRSGSERTLQFELLCKSFNCGHNHLTRATELPQIVWNFIKNAINKTEMLDQ